MQRPECNECKEEKEIDHPLTKAEECHYDVDESRLLLKDVTSACHRCRKILLVCDEKRPHCTTCMTELKKVRSCKYEMIGDSGDLADGL